MRKILERLIIFFIGFPVLLAVVVFFPQYNHVILNLLIVVFSILAAVEFRNILVHKNIIISVPEAAILGALCPAAWTAVICCGLPEFLITCVVIAGAIWILISRTFSSREKLGACIEKTVAGLSVIIYPGFFTAWIIRMAVFSHADMVILVFLLMTLMNDATAWAAGFLFGKNNRGRVAASPSKSIAGFIGGLFASALMGIAAAIFIPGAFSSKLMPSVPACVILGLVTGVAAILGDLSESALKRSAGVKDSGSLILGRGGALDSIDSLILAAPVYYILYRVLF